MNKESTFYYKLGIKLTISLITLIFGWSISSEKIVLEAMIYALLVCICVLISVKIEIRRED